jgi:hypothetical protein
MIRERYRDYLEPGKKYRVAKAFVDAVKSVHREGETFTFLGYTPNGFGECTHIFTLNGEGHPGGFSIDWTDTLDNLIENLKAHIEEVK